MSDSSSKNVLYLPGKEPEKIRERLENFFRKLDEAYPDKVVVGLRDAHYSWGETLTDLYRKLGYANGNELLIAYGYKPETKKRDKQDPIEIINELKKRYSNGATVDNVPDLKKENPDLAGKIQSLANRRKEFTDMKFSRYLLQEGILLEKTKDSAKERMDFSNPEIKSLWKESEKYIEKKPIIEFSNKRFLLCGVKKYRGNWVEIAQLITSLGGEYTLAVSGLVDYFVYCPGFESADFGKAVTYQNYGYDIKIVTLDDLEKAIKKEVPDYSALEPLDLTMEEIESFWQKASDYIEKNPVIQFTNKKFVLSGVKECRNERRIIDTIIHLGGSYNEKLSSKTDYLVYCPGYKTSDVGNAVMNQSKGIAIKIITLDDFEKELVKANTNYKAIKPLNLSQNEISSLWLEAEKYIEKNPVIEFKGKQFVFKGVKRIPNSNLLPVADAVKALGGVCKKDVTGSVDYLVYGMGYETDDVGKAVASQTVKIITADDLEDAIKRENPNYFWTMENINNLWCDADKYIDKNADIEFKNKKYFFDTEFSSYLNVPVIRTTFNNGGVYTNILSNTTDYYVYSKGWETPLFGAAAHMQSKGKPIKIISYDILEEAIEKINPSYVKIDKIREINEKYMAFPNSDDFIGANIVMDRHNLSYREEISIKEILKSMGAKLQKKLNDDTDYYLKEFNVFIPYEEEFKSVIKKAPQAKIISLESLYYVRKKEAEKILSLPKAEKAKLAIEMFHNFNKNGYSGLSLKRDSILSESYIFGNRIDEHSQGFNDAKKFLENIVDGKHGMEKEIICAANKALELFLHSFFVLDTWVLSTNEEYDGEACALFAIACFMFANINLSAKLQFISDIYDRRGNHIGYRSPCWELSKKNPEGLFYILEYNDYDGIYEI